MKITENFDSSEFDCRDGTPYPSAYLTRLQRLCSVLEVVRAELKAAISIESGYRTRAYNKKIGGAPLSQHIQGLAADLKVKGVSPKKVYKTFESLIAEGKIPEGGLGLYKTWVHYDLRPYKARWDKTKGER